MNKKLPDSIFSSINLDGNLMIHKRKNIHERNYLIKLLHEYFTA